MSDENETKAGTGTGTAEKPEHYERSFAENGEQWGSWAAGIAVVILAVAVIRAIFF